VYLLRFYLTEIGGPMPDGLLVGEAMLLAMHRRDTYALKRVVIFLFTQRKMSF
jgi:hypothetical protein